MDHRELHLKYLIMTFIANVRDTGLGLFGFVTTPGDAFMFMPYYDRVYKNANQINSCFLKVSDMYKIESVFALIC